MGKVTELDSIRRQEKPSLIRTPGVPLGADVRKARAHGCRLRAEMLRAISSEVISPETTRSLLELAEGYDRMASTLDKTHSV